VGFVGFRGQTELGVSWTKVSWTKGFRGQGFRGQDRGFVDKGFRGQTDSVSERNCFIIGAEVLLAFSIRNSLDRVQQPTVGV
jgi:hypothetical protein